MSPDDKQAQLLADWLDNPSQGSPEDLDPEVLEAVYALRPELAPAPRVSVDDILAGVSGGPFGSNAAPAAEAAPPAAEVIDLASVRRRRAGIWGTLGALAAAALVVVTVMPAKDEMMVAGEAAAPMDPADRQEEAMGGSGSGVSKMSAKTSAPARAPAADAPMGWDIEANADDVTQGWDIEANATSEGPQRDQGQAEPAPPADLQAAKQELAKVESKRKDDSPKQAKEASEYDQLDLVGGRELEEVAPSKASSSYGSAAPSAAPSAGSSSTGRSGAYDADGEDDYGEIAQAESTSRRNKKSRPTRSNKAAESAPATEAEPMEEAEVSGALADGYGYTADEDPDDNRAGPSIPTDLATLRAAAVPSDYGSAWYTRLEGEAYDRISAAVDTASSQSSSAAATTCAGLISDSDYRIGQDMAGRAARYALSAGDATAALSYVRSGKARSSANTAFLARLYQLEGEAYERQGNTTAAKAAYTTAVNLNAARGVWGD